MKKIILFLILLLILSVGFSTVTGTCGCRDTGLGCVINGCPDHSSYVSGCSIDSCFFGCSSSGSYSVCSCDSGYCQLGNTCVDNSWNDDACGSSCVDCPAGQRCFNGNCAWINNYDSYSGYCTTIVGTISSTGNDEQCGDNADNWEIDSCDTGDGGRHSPQCTCSETYYRNCDLDASISSTDYTNGCETDIRYSTSNCNSCGVTCTDAPCLDDGDSTYSCGLDNRWTQCTVGLLGGCTSGCTGIQTGIFSRFRPTSEGSNTGFCVCDDTTQDCNQGTDGCETSRLSIYDCGSCGNDCVANGCSGSNYAGYTGTVLGICDISCSGSYSNLVLISASCSATTKDTGYCNTNNDCSDYNGGVSTGGFINSLCQPDFDNDNWCCPKNQCGSDGACYDVDEVIVNNGNVYVCTDTNPSPNFETMRWGQVSTILSLGKLIQYNDGVTSDANMDGSTFFTHTGITGDCDQNEYNSCSFNGPFYSYQYCSNPSVVFDGMFNLEVPNNVPVLVSEQSLYDPYGESKNIIDLNGCTGSTTTEDGVVVGGLNC